MSNYILNTILSMDTISWIDDDYWGDEIWL